MSTDPFAIYLESLIASWEALAAPRVGATVVRGAGYVAARFPEPYLNNAVIHAPAAIEAAMSHFQDGDAYALWCLDTDAATAAALADRGFVHSEVTRPMLRRLETLPEPDGTPVVPADLDRYAELIEVPVELLRDVPGLRAYADAGYDSGLVLQERDDDVFVGMVYTRPQARRRGLASAVLTVALRDAVSRGARTATLQATPMGETVYAAYGFEPVGRWQEWVLSDAHQ